MPPHPQVHISVCVLLQGMFLKEWGAGGPENKGTDVRFLETADGYSLL